MESVYTIKQIKRWLETLDVPGMTAKAILKYHLTSDSLNRANGFVPNTHVENETALEDIRTPASMEENTEHSENKEWGPYQNEKEYPY